jgi:NADP-dependent 3-hydroxy acid dehydrogenase YdfG
VTALSEQTVWLIGGASGIGRATALRLADGGADVVVSDVDADGLATLELETAQLDIAQQPEVERVARAIEERHGRIDALVVCAGTNVLQRNFDSVTAADWDLIMGVNVSGMFYACRAVLPAMRARGQGTIVNIASWAAIHPARFTGPAYNASKRAVLALTESITLEACGDGIRATAILPEETNTPLLNLRAIGPPSEEDKKRMLQPEDIARAIAFVLESPPHVTINELVISPTRNRFVLGELA